MAIVTRMDQEEWNHQDFVDLARAHSTRHRSPLVVFDVDCTLVGASVGNNSWNVRPGAVDTVKALVVANCEVQLWSGGGKNHATEVAQFLKIDGLVTAINSKPSFPMQTEDVRALFDGTLPDLIIDDDLGERVEESPFVHVSTFWGPLDAF